MKVRKLISSMMIFSILLTGCNVEAVETNQKNPETNREKPKYVFYFIGDGMGLSQRTLAELSESTTKDRTELAMNHLDESGLISTMSNNSMITDSAAAGTALSSGNVTNNGQINTKPLDDEPLTNGKTEDIDPSIEGEAMKHLGEGLHEADVPVGIVTTTRISHATPAAFSSHSVNRNDEAAIAEQQVEFAPELIAGGGREYLIPQNQNGSKRNDDKNLIQDYKDKGYTYFDDINEYNQNVAETNTPVVATFEDSHLPYEIDQEDEAAGLSEITKASINHMYNNYQDGFFMMVEGGRIDHAAHNNDAATMNKETLEFSNAVDEALAFYEEHQDETLIVVGADHETGGLGLGKGEDYFLTLDSLNDYKGSTEEILSGYYKKDMNHDDVLTYLENDYGLENLTTREKDQLNTAMDLMDEKEPDKENGYAGMFMEDYGVYDPLEATVNKITANRAGIGFTTYAHTATFVPITATGVGSEIISEASSEVELSQKIAELMNVDIEGN